MKKNSGDISAWYDFLTDMNETRFFDLMRLYAGEIKTPYNKQKLIETLTAFLHREENRRILFALLSQEDLILVAAVMYIPFCTKEKAAAFFGSRFSFAFLHDGFLNLEERLIIYRKKNHDGADETPAFYFDINPLLREDLEKRAPLSLLFSSYEGEENTEPSPVNSGPLVSGHILASWFAFIAEYPDCCRTDGSFKKKAAEMLEERFAGIPLDFLSALHKTLVNLSLFKQNGFSAEPDKAKSRSFAELPPLSRYAYICAAFCAACNAASCGLVRRDILQKNASLVLDIFTILKKGGASFCVSPSYILRLIFLLQEQERYCVSGEKIAAKEGRLRRLFRENAVHNAESEALGGTEESFNAENLLSAFIRFGILVPVSGKNLYAVNPVLFSDTHTAVSSRPENTSTEKIDQITESKNAISIDAGFSVTFLREIPLPLFFDVTACMEIEFCGTVSRFRITRSACLRAFESGVSPDRFIDMLETLSSHSVPQNLRFSLHDWYTFYASASLFKGYILQVAKDKRLQTENNPILAAYIKVTLAPGIYLLDFSSDEVAADVIKKSGLSFIGGVKKFDTETESLPLSPLIQSRQSDDSPFDFLCGIPSCCSAETAETQTAETDADFRKRHIAAMEAEVKKKNLSKESEEALMLRIRRKTVLNAAQLSENSVRLEKNEASGMDFLGKIRIIETALACSDPIEAVYGEKTLYGYPAGLEKQSGDAFLIMHTADDAQTYKISVAQARLIRRKPSSVFSTR